MINPNLFFDILKQLKNQQFKFKLVVLEEFDTEMRCFYPQAEHFLMKFSNLVFVINLKIMHNGYGNLIISSYIKSRFFGVSIMESVYMQYIPNFT